MTLHLTPDVLSAGYDFLRTTPPFKSWKLPPSAEVTFVVSVAEGEHGDYKLTKSGEDIISLSSKTIGHTVSLFAVLAHEMVHMKMAHDGTINEKNFHCKRFQRLAKSVCKYHGFDPKVFI